MSDVKEAMDVFGKALYAYWRGDTESELYFIEPDGERTKINLKRYFRSRSGLTELEKTAIDLASGEILDVGCATGYYIPDLMKKGDVEGIDISEEAIKIANERGLDNCRVADIFKLKTNKKYDTIMLLENGPGMAGTLRNVKNLLKILASLIKDDGQIISVMRNIKGKDYVRVTLQPEWKGEKGPEFDWVHFNVDFFAKVCGEQELEMEVLEKSGENALVRITK